MPAPCTIRRTTRTLFWLASSLIAFLASPIAVCQSTTSARLPVGPIELNVKSIHRTSVVSFNMLLGALFSAELTVKVGKDASSATTVPLGTINNQSLPEFVEQVNESNKGLTAQLSPEASGSRVVLQTTDPSQALDVQGTVTDENHNATLTITPGAPDLIVSLEPATRDALQTLNDQIEALHGKKNHFKATVHLPDGSFHELFSDGKWVLPFNGTPLAGLTLGDQNDPLCATNALPAVPDLKHLCHFEFLLVRIATTGDLRVGMQVKPKIADLKRSGTLSAGGNAQAQPSEELQVYPELVNDKGSTYFVNETKLDPDIGPLTFDASRNVWRIYWYRNRQGCRAYSPNEEDSAVISLRPKLPKAHGQVANGIEVGAAKIFDVASLRKLLADTATQLAAITGFNSSSINAAIGNLQGVTRDTSFLSAQVTTTPLPTITQTSSNGANSSNATTSIVPSQSSASTIDRKSVV